MGKIDTRIRTFGQEITEIYFGEKPTIETLWDGCWNPAYRYKKRLKNLPYYPILKIMNDRKEKNKIKDIDIIFYPNACRKNKPLPVKAYNWVTPYFWIQYGFYPKTKLTRIKDEFYKSNPKKISEFRNRHPIEEDFEIIFNDIWKICVLREGKVSFPQMNFTNLIWTLRYLIENTIIFPIENINFTSWKLYVSNYLGELEGLFNSEFEQKGWEITEKDSPDKIRTAFVYDIKIILNTFFEEVKTDNGLGIFLHKIVNSYVDELIKRKLFIKCPYCKLLANYREGKKYCSYLVDGKNCGKKARNKRYYQIKGKERLPKYRQTTQELRALYKDRGIKK